MQTTSVSQVFFFENSVSSHSCLVAMKLGNFKNSKKHETFKAGFDKILRKIHAEERKFVSCIKYTYRK